VQARARRHRRDPEHPRRLARGQLLHADQHQQLAIPVPQAGERLDHAAWFGRQLNRELAPQLLAQPLGQARAPLHAPPVVGEHPARRRVQPKPRLVPERHVAEPAPGDEEGLRDHVRRVLRVGAPPQRVPENLALVVSVETREPRLGQLAGQRLIDGGIPAHGWFMSASGPAFHFGADRGRLRENRPMPGDPEFDLSAEEARRLGIVAVTEDKRIEAKASAER